MKFGLKKAEFLDAIRYAQCAAYLGLDVNAVAYTASERDEEGFMRKYYAMDDGSVVSELTSKGFGKVMDKDIISRVHALAS